MENLYPLCPGKILTFFMIDIFFRVADDQISHNFPIFFRIKEFPVMQKRNYFTGILRKLCDKMRTIGAIIRIISIITPVIAEICMLKNWHIYPYFPGRRIIRIYPFPRMKIIPENKWDTVFRKFLLPVQTIVEVNLPVCLRTVVFRINHFFIHPCLLLHSEMLLWPRLTLKLLSPAAWFRKSG